MEWNGEGQRWEKWHLVQVTWARCYPNSASWHPPPTVSSDLWQLKSWHSPRRPPCQSRRFMQGIRGNIFHFPYQNSWLRPITTTACYTIHFGKAVCYCKAVRQEKKSQDWADRVVYDYWSIMTKLNGIYAPSVDLINILIIDSFTFTIRFIVKALSMLKRVAIGLGQSYILWYWVSLLSQGIVKWPGIFLKHAVILKLANLPPPPIIW